MQKIIFLREKQILFVVFTLMMLNYMEDRQFKRWRSWRTLKLRICMFNIYLEKNIFYFLKEKLHVPVSLIQLVETLHNICRDRDLINSNKSIQSDPTCQNSKISFLTIRMKKVIRNSKLQLLKHCHIKRVQEVFSSNHLCIFLAANIQMQKTKLIEVDSLEVRRNMTFIHVRVNLFLSL